MDKLIIHPTDIAQWHALINEAQQASSIVINEELESYLVFLLMRFAERPEIAHSVFAMEYLETHQQVGQQQADNLQKIGDKCLLFCGLFPGRAERRRVKVSYYVDLGQGAYDTLANHEQVTQTDLFAALSNDFVPLMDVLQASRTISNEDPFKNNGLSVAAASELWQDTQSQQALDTLQNAANSSPIIVSKIKKDEKH